MCMLKPDAVTADNAAPATVKAAVATRWCECNHLMLLLLHDMHVLLQVSTSLTYSISTGCHRLHHNEPL